MVEKLTTSKITVTPATTYLVSFKEEGWAAMIVDDITGLVSVQSDWLNGGKCWPKDCLAEGQTLTGFLAGFAGRSCEYLARKFFYEESNKWDKEATHRAFRAEIRRMRKEKELTAEEAKAAYEAISSVEEHYVPDELHVVNEDWQCMKTGPTGQYRMMEEAVLPALCAAVKNGGIDDDDVEGLPPGEVLEDIEETP